MKKDISVFSSEYKGIFTKIVKWFAVVDFFILYLVQGIFCFEILFCNLDTLVFQLCLGCKYFFLLYSSAQL